MKSTPILIAVILTGMLACKSKKQSLDYVTTPTSQQDALPENSDLYDPNYAPPGLNTHQGRVPEYRESAERINDVLHTKLEVSFDFKHHYLNGKATIDIKPYYYPVNSLSLDAKGMDIHKVGMLTKGQFTPLKFTYDSLDIQIDLGRIYTRDESYTIYIEYTAKPDELEMGGSSAISGDKGLYFINADSSDKNKPTQVWTQGETEASSCWFPTIDRPNEKMTQEIIMTVPKDFVSLSNGLMISSKKNADGSHVDHWKMDQPHSPYLAMMAIGPFAVVKDTWKKSNGKEIEVNYYVEPKYEPFARDIFGETPRMIEFFSKRLGVEYAWDKYSQVVVRDYVSGAMENTTATIHGEFLHRTRRELMDANNESIIAHELFHHWFGDLVTCESWSNLPLNESFANYSQFLWDEFKYGDDEAAYNANIEAQGYVMQSQQQGYRHMIRYQYEDKEDMFDGNSYNKGGRILHMLRHVVGDEAFFESLKVYLTENKFQAAEIHHLRLAFEKVTGRDLNWFFNQWFLNLGHPVMEYTQSYEDGKLMLRVRQKQNKEDAPLYRLPMLIDVYTAAGKTTHQVEILQADTTFVFDLASEPLCVNPDAAKVLLCEKEDVRPISQWIHLYRQGGNFMDRYEAIRECARSGQAEALELIFEACDDKFWYIRELAVKNLKKLSKSKGTEVKNKLMAMAQNDPRPSVRSTAVKYLQKYFSEDTALIPTFQKATADSSYDVMSEAFIALSKIDPKSGMELARKHEKEESAAVRDAIAQIYAENGTADEHDFFAHALQEASGMEKYALIIYYAQYLKRMDMDQVDVGLKRIREVAAGDGGWFIRLSAYQALGMLKSHYAKKELEAQTLAESLKMEGKTMEATEAERDQIRSKGMAEKIEKMVEELKANETDKNVLKYVH